MPLPSQPLDAAAPYPRRGTTQARRDFVAWLPLLQRGYRAAADREASRFGLSQAMAWPLVMIGRLGDGVRPGELAEVLGIEPASLVRQLDQLVDAALIERRDSQVDRRAKTLHLTDAGRATCAGIEASLDVLRAQIFDGIDEIDLQTCLRVFALLDSRVGRGARLNPPGHTA